MSRPTPHIVIPQPLPCPIDLGKFLINYYVIRSFQTNWSSLPLLLHLPVCRPALDNVAAGDHFFSYKIDPGAKPIVSVLFSILPAYDFDHQVIISDSTYFDGKAIFIFGYNIPDFLPILVSDVIESVAIKHATNLSFFISTLDDFIYDYHRPVSPITSHDHYYPSPPSPLECQQ